MKFVDVAVVGDPTDEWGVVTKGHTLALAALATRGGVKNRVKGIRLGGCVDAVGTDRVGAMRRSGHAHTSARDGNRGYICIKSRKIETIITTDGAATLLLAHEFAHIATMQGHTKKWRDLMIRLGYPDEAKAYERPQYFSTEAT